jgi:hypothetical protein
MIMEWERWQWGRDEGEGKKRRTECVYSLKEDDNANDCERVGMLNVSNDMST